MKTDCLADVLTFSEKRRAIMFLLLEAPKTLDDIKSKLKVSTPEIQPKLKELIAENMVEKIDDYYYLTPLGNVAAIHYKAFFETTTAIEKHKDYWNTHDLTSIPKDFLFRIKDLNGCDIVRLEDCDFGESHKPFLENVSNALSFKGVTCIFIREWNYLFSELSNERIPIEIIITPSVYEKIMNGYAEDLARGLQNPNAHVYVCEESLGASFATAELLPAGKFFSLSLNFKNGLGHDHRSDMMSLDSRAVKWGEDLFEYYKARSSEIKIDRCMTICSEVNSKLTDIEV